MHENQDGSSWRETHFTPEQWASVPSTAGLWPSGQSDWENDERLRTMEEIRLLVLGIVTFALTPRQRQVMELYYLENRTQTEVAAPPFTPPMSTPANTSGLRDNHMRGSIAEFLQSKIQPGSNLSVPNEVQAAPPAQAALNLLEGNE